MIDSLFWWVGAVVTAWMAAGVVVVVAAVAYELACKTLVSLVPLHRARLAHIRG